MYARLDAGRDARTFLKEVLADIPAIGEHAREKLLAWRAKSRAPNAPRSSRPCHGGCLREARWLSASRRSRCRRFAECATSTRSTSPRGKASSCTGQTGPADTLADAIEWFFTGDIELLAKEGRDHAVRHLGAFKEQQTLVAIETSGELGGVCTPKSPNAAAVEAASRETFLLRGRTIADFVDKSKGEKWGALQRLLGLGAIDELRADLQRARNDLKKHRDEGAAKLKQAEISVRALKVEPEDTEKALAKLAKACGFEPRASIDDYLQLNLRDIIEPQKSSAAGRRAGNAALLGEIEKSSLDVSEAALKAWNDTLLGLADKTELDLGGSRGALRGRAPRTQTVSPLREEGLRRGAPHAPHGDALGDAGAGDEARSRRAGRVRGRDRAHDGAPGPHALGSQGTRARSRARRGSSERGGGAQESRERARGRERRRSDRLREGPPRLGRRSPKDALEPDLRRRRRRREPDAGVRARAAPRRRKAMDRRQAGQRARRAGIRGRRRGARVLPDGATQIRPGGPRADLVRGRAPLRASSSDGGHRQGRRGDVGRQGHRARRRLLRPEAAPAARCAQRVVHELGRHRALPRDGADVQRAPELPRARRRRQQLRRHAPRPPERALHRGVRRLAARRPHARPVLLRADPSQSKRLGRVPGPRLVVRAGPEPPRAARLDGRRRRPRAPRRGRDGRRRAPRATRPRARLEGALRGLEVPLPYRRGNDNEFREIGQLLQGLRRLLKDDSRTKAFLASIDGTLRALEADAQSVLNAEAHASAEPLRRWK